MIDFTMMYAVHAAFRRDLRLLAHHLDEARWDMFTRQLLVHHQAEDASLWPVVRERLGGDARGLAILADMEAEHALIDPLLEARDVVKLAEALNAHLDHEEREALPLIDSVLTEQEWARFAAGTRERQGGVNEDVKAFLAWLLEDAPGDLRERVFAFLPPQARQILAS
ncbi:hemerythrin domain-containing protein [Streptosporangiaceae bacterium NEAU-GS5]|nr:hemerythrin domain-containing protein [Streptosporangiaceae bacterium NEAU-GS5]